MVKLSVCQLISNHASIAQDKIMNEHKSQLINECISTMVKLDNAT